MMNPLNLVQLMRGNPEQLFNTMINGNPQMKNNPVIQNAVKLVENKDEKGLEQLARNLCKANNVDIQKMLDQLNINNLT